MFRHMGPHVLGKTVFDPEKVLLTLERASHVHHDVTRGGVSFNLVPEPYCRSHGADEQLDEVEQAGRHGGGDGVPDVELFCGVAGVDAPVPSAPCFLERRCGNVGGIDEPKPRPQTEERFTDLRLSL